MCIPTDFVEVITIDKQTRISKVSDALKRVKGLSPFRQGYVLGKLEEMVDSERRKQEAGGARKPN